ncbi:LytTR family DNA-binding domain-containing protein [Brevundimonas aveniformis]|uniref:LytTR family DNA-binding domain-containing protein n=1 Tax=Brevundimonas aveniformis TaxID=370977 RepID=UPI000426A3CE|nr:LytTR family DNA-binding domain-containing protein [Brevundimonas aveniformis]
MSTQPSTTLMSWARGLGAAVIVGAFLSFTGAFGTGHLPLVSRFVYWVPLMVMGSIIGGLIVEGFRRWSGLDERPIVRGVAMTVVMAVPITLIVWVATTLMMRLAWDWAYFAGLIGPVFLVSAAMTVIGHLLERPTETHAGAVDAAPAAFLDRLPPKLRGAEIYAVGAEDHYLRVYTDRGTNLVLMRLADAIKELEGLEGAQVHRSWWVAKNAVLEARRGDGRATLSLKGGITAPVSRRYAAGLRRAGWY